MLSYDQHSIGGSPISTTPEAGFFNTLGYAYYRSASSTWLSNSSARRLNANLPAQTITCIWRALRANGDTQRARQSYERALQLGGANFSEANQARQELASLRRS